MSQKELENEIREDLNKILLKLKDVNDYRHSNNTNDVYDKDYLTLVKSYVEHLVDDETYELARGEELYYSSYCVNY